MDPSDHEYTLLESIYRSADVEPVRQRALAKRAGISLGMTNVIIRKLAQKGWVIARRVNSRNIQYAVTPAGIEEISRRSFTFIKRTVQNVAHYKDVLERFIVDVEAKNFNSLILVGKSDFDFILSYLCEKHNLEFTQSEAAPCDARAVRVFAEDYPHSSLNGNGAAGSDGVYLHDILIDL